MASQRHTSQVVQGTHQLSDTDYLAYQHTAAASPDKPCIVFLHGLCSNMTGWVHAMTQLKATSSLQTGTADPSMIASLPGCASAPLVLRFADV
jgi:hypothetical protein